MGRETRIAAFGRMYEQPEALQDIGKRVVRQAAKAAVAERLGLKSEEPSVIRKVRRGEQVPADLLDASNLIVDPAGLALGDWSESWLDVLVWEYTWGESEGMAQFPTPPLTDPMVKLKAEEILTEEEMARVRILKILEQG